MKGSATYQAILNEGRQVGMAQEAVHLLLRRGRKWFGTPEPSTVASLEAVSDLGRLEEMAERLLNVTSWEELLTPL